MMKDQMTELKFDTKKQPLGRLSTAQIKEGFTYLKKIEAAINNGTGDLSDLTSKYYTVIPHVFGMRKPPVINSLDM